MSEVAKAEPLYIPKEVVDLGRGKGNASDEKLKAAYDAWANTHDKVNKKKSRALLLRTTRLILLANT